LVSTPAGSKAAEGLQVRPQGTGSLTALVCASADSGISAIVAAQAPAPIAARRLSFAFGLLLIRCRAALVFIEVLLPRRVDLDLAMAPRARLREDEVADSSDDGQSIV